MDDDKSIFLKSDSSDIKKDVFDYKVILSTIPKESSKSPNRQLLSMGYKEWRWRFLKLHNMVAEISYLDAHTHKRYYLNNSNKWVEKDISIDYDKYVVDSYYYYSKSS